jgi:hypothetical protein
MGHPAPSVITAIAPCAADTRKLRRFITIIPHAGPTHDWRGFPHPAQSLFTPLAKPRLPPLPQCAIPRRIMTRVHTMTTLLEICVETPEGLAEAIAGARTGSNCARHWRWAG